MYIDMTPTKYNTYDCYQNNIIAVLGNYFKVDYRPFFWSGFDFRFLIKQTTNYINITGYNNYQDQILLDQCGVKINYLSKPCAQEFKQIIINELNKLKPLGLRLNGSDLPWNNDNRNMNYHYLLIIGVDISASRLYCCDSFLSAEIQAIDIFYIYERVEYLLLYCISEDNQTSFNKSINNFLTCFHCNSKNKKTDLSLFVKSTEIIFKNLNDIDINNNPIIFQLSRVCWSRYNFMKSLEYFCDHYNNRIFDNVLKYSDSLFDTWTKLKNIFIKATLIGDTRQFDKCKEDIIRIIEETEAIIEKNLDHLKY